MNSAVITPCSHFFHAGCLKKWLYVQETCPLCHSQLKSQSPATNIPNQDTPAANQNPAGQAEQGTSSKKQKDGISTNDGKEERAVEQEGDDGPAVSDGETSSSCSPSSSGMPSAPLHHVSPPLSSSPCSSPHMTDSLQNQLVTDHSSSSSSSTTHILDVPETPSSSFHNLNSFSSHVPAQAEINPAEPEPSIESSSGPSSQSGQPALQSVENTPPPCAL